MMMSDDIARYRDLVAENSGGFNPQEILRHITVDSDDGETPMVKLEMPVDMVLPHSDNVMLSSIFMDVDLEEDEDQLSLGAVVGSADGGHIADNLSDRINLYDIEPTVRKALSNAGFSDAALGSVEFDHADVEILWHQAPDVAREIKKAIESNGGVGLAIIRNHGFDQSAPDDEDNKTALMKWILSTIRENGRVTFGVKLAIDSLKKHGAQWPELDQILKSYKAS